jgi:zinc D-Ala-D-Ala carboxypeptidase
MRPAPVVQLDYASSQTAKFSVGREAVSPLRHLGLAFVFAITAVMGAGVAAGPLVFGATLPPPECRYDDVLTAHHEFSEWRITLVDPIFNVPQSYLPPKLVSVSNAGIQGSGLIRKFVIPDLTALAAAARRAGKPLRVTSAYRSWSEQRVLLRREIKNYGEVRGRQRVARPGHSEHQLGTTIDFGSGGDKHSAWSYSDWATTPAGYWLKKNGWKFGFLLSYPKDYTATTCYEYEPWHYRYVGRQMAADVRASGLTLREYLWKNFQ